VTVNKLSVTAADVVNVILNLAFYKQNCIGASYQSRLDKTSQEFFYCIHSVVYH